jgi:hypothetical protein
MERRPLLERAFYGPSLHLNAWLESPATLQEFEDLGELTERHLIDQGHPVS